MDGEQGWRVVQNFCIWLSRYRILWGHSPTLPVFSHHTQLFLAKHIQGFMESLTHTLCLLSSPGTVSREACSGFYGVTHSHSLSSLITRNCILLSMFRVLWGHSLTLPVFSHHPELFLAKHIQGFMGSPSTLTIHPLSLPVSWGHPPSCISTLSPYLELFLTKHIQGFIRPPSTLTLHPLILTTQNCLWLSIFGISWGYSPPSLDHHLELFLAKYTRGFMRSPSTVTFHPLSLPGTASGQACSGFHGDTHPHSPSSLSTWNCFWLSIFMVSWDHIPP